MKAEILFSKRNLVIVALILFIVFRLFIAAWVGQLGPDEAAHALTVKGIIDGDSIPLVSLLNTHGFYNGPYQIYFLVLVYSLTRFHFGLTLLLVSCLYIASVFLIASAISSKEIKWWVLLFGLTSPLQIYFSMTGLGENALVFFIPALVLFIHSKNGSKLWREIIIGFLLGMTLGISISSLPFIVGIVLARFFIYRKKAISIIFGQFVGMLLGIMPYAIGLWINRSSMSPTLVRSGDKIARNFLDVSRSLFRYFGQQVNVRMNGAGAFLFVENLLAYITTVLIAALFLISVAFFYYNRKKVASSPVLLAVFICAVFYIPFGWITNTLALGYGGQVIWWITPIIIPVIVFWILPRKARVACLSLLLIYNLIVITTQHTKKVIDGTQASYMYGLGPSWWAYEDVASVLCAEINNQLPKQNVTFIEMSTDMHYVSRVRIQYVLENLIKLKYPDCAQLIQWSDAGEGCFLRVEPDSRQVNMEVVWVDK